MTTTRVIGLYSPAPQQGKTTVAKYLKKHHGFQIVSFATPLKRMVTQFLHSMGHTPAEIEHYLTEGKSRKLSPIGVDTRHILRTLGYEWGRECIHPEVWVQMWERQVKQHLAKGISVVSDDVRFLNEYEALFRLSSPRPLKAAFWRITRSELYDTPDHPSEGFAESPSIKIHAEIHNYGTEAELEQQVEKMLSEGV